MKIIFGKSKWEMWDDPLETFLERVRNDGFGATEIYLKSLSESPAEIAALHEAYGLGLVAQILSKGSTPGEHLRCVEESFDFAARCDPILINNHIGRDIFTFDENVRIFRRIMELGAEAGIPVVVETHRGRPTYSATQTRKYLEAMPDLRITADFSHWMLVHESDLSDQKVTVDLAVDRSDYIHARVGYEEGPQVPDPRAPEWEPHVANHVNLWERIVDARREAGADVLCITPEFGPPDFLHTLPFSREPVGDPWELNVYMKEMLEAELMRSGGEDELALEDGACRG